MTDDTTEVSSWVEERFGDTDRRALAAAVVGGVSLLAAFVAFLSNSTFTAVPVLVFVVTLAYGWYAHQAETGRAMTFLATVVVVVVLALITLYLLWQSVPAFAEVGGKLFVRAKSPLLPMIWGTFVTTLLATVIAGAFGVAGALFVAEMAPRRLRTVIRPAIEVLAGIPSIVYGFIGFTILNTYMQARFGLANTGSFFITGVVVGMMALPTVISVAEDAIESVPEAMKRGALAMGATDWQVMKSITVPAAFSGISAAVLLGVGRAVGEAMAATLILGNVPALPDPLSDVFANGATLTSFIVTQGTNADGLALSVVFAAGVVLFLTVMVLSVASQLIEIRMTRSLGGNR